MYAPHSVTLYLVCRDGTAHLTLLEGVLLVSRQGNGVLKNLPVSDDAATLFVPFDCSATDPISGLPQQYCPPEEFDRLEDPGGFWTIGPRDARSCVDCFFVKGRVVRPEMSFSEINDRYDNVFRVTSADTMDFGSEHMRHWQIGGK